jgi:hypothetical protein
MCAEKPLAFMELNKVIFEVSSKTPASHPLLLNPVAVVVARL